jgi:hypothetical protein
MRRLPREAVMKKLILLGAWVASCVPALAGVPVTDGEREQFLLKAEVVKQKGAPGGITGSYRATLRLGDVQHDAHIQPHDEYKSQLQLGSGLELDFRDTWRNNVAAYRIDRMLGLGMIPVTVVRRDERSNKPASYTWWVDDVLMVERERYEKKTPAPNPTEWNRQIFVVRLFDQLIYNFDRNLGNLVIDKSWRMWMIDHTRAFKVFKELRDEKNLSATCEADLLARLRALERPALVAATKDLLTEGQVDGLLGRRDKIVRIYEQRIADKGEQQVLYHLPSRLAAVPAAP